MKVKFFALLREITRSKETTDFSGETVESLLENLCRNYGDRMSTWIFADSSAPNTRRLSNNVIILVNGRAIDHLNGLATTLSDNDEVAIFPRLAGG